MPHSLRLAFGSDAASSVIVAWGTDSANDLQRVQYRTVPGGATQTAIASQYAFPPLDGATGTGFVHKATLVGLTPGQLYEYRVGVGLVWSAWFTFRTAPSSADATVRFTTFGDTIVDSASIEIASDAGAWDPDFHVHLGDTSYFATADPSHAAVWRSWFEAQAPLIASAPYMVAPGNNDRTNAADPYLYQSRVLAVPDQTGNSVAWSFRAGPVGVVGISQPGDRSAAHGFTTESLDAALSFLDDPQIKWRFVAMHSAAYGTGTRHNSACHFREFDSLFAAHGVDFVLGAHNHAFERTLPIVGGHGANVDPEEFEQGDGTTFVISGGVSVERSGHANAPDGSPGDFCLPDNTADTECVPVVPGQAPCIWESNYYPVDYVHARETDPANYVRFTVDATSVHMEMVAADGRVLDEFRARGA